ncbi:MAG: hypothetical protein MAG453_00652 [Calditrichaeota bacterium]|nr:hypothetical protein [Calditrichota bacterium]
MLRIGKGGNGPRFGGWLDLALQVALTLALSVTLLALAGRWLDGQLGTSPLFLIIGVLWGAGGGTYWLVVRVKHFSEQQERRDRGENGDSG